MDIAQRLLDMAYSGKAVDPVAEAAGNEILSLRERLTVLEDRVSSLSRTVDALLAARYE
jgi:hypothetical protein